MFFYFCYASVRHLFGLHHRTPWQDQSVAPPKAKPFVFANLWSSIFLRLRTLRAVEERPLRRGIAVCNGKGIHIHQMSSVTVPIQGRNSLVEYDERPEAAGPVVFFSWNLEYGFLDFFPGRTSICCCWLNCRWSVAQLLCHLPCINAMLKLNAMICCKWLSTFQQRVSIVWEMSTTIALGCIRRIHTYRCYRCYSVVS